MYPTKVRQVKFPCGRLGLEVETMYPNIGGSEPSYRYFYNGSDYINVAQNEGVKLKFDYYGKIEGLRYFVRKEIKLDLFEAARQLSVDFTDYPGPNDVPKPL